MRSGSGFTLIEVLVALTLGGMLVLAAHAAFGGALDVTARLDQRRAEQAVEMRGRAWLVRAAGSLDPSSSGSVGFQGSPHQMRFTTRLRGRDGAFRMETVRLDAANGWLIAQPDTGTPLRLLSINSDPFAPGVTLDYLLETGADSRWVRAWHSPVSAPLAIRLRLARASGATDTLLLAIGPRG